MSNGAKEWKTGRDLLGLFFFLALVNLPCFAPSFRFLPTDDTMAYVQQFFSVYNEYFLHGEIPLWQPYNLYGSPIDYDLLYTMSPALWFTALAGKWMGATDALLLFKLATFVEQAALLVGVYLLARRLFAHRAPVLLVCLGAAATTYWGLQLYWNFRLYYLVPLVLFFIVRYSDTRDLKHALAAGVVGVLSLVGNVIYCAPAFLFLYGVFAAALFLGARRNPLPRLRTLFRPAPLLLLALLAALAAAFFTFSLHGLDFTASYTRGRDPLSHRVLFGTFMTYMSDPYDPVLLAEFVFAAPTRLPITLFIGLIPLLFLAYALVHVRGQPVFNALLAAAAAVLLVSLARLTCVAPLAYFGVPLFDCFRHLSLLRPMAKILLLIAAGCGFDRWLSSPREPALVRAGLVLLGVILLADLFSLAAFSRLIPYALAFEDPLAASFHVMDVLFVAALLVLIVRFRGDAAGRTIAATVTALYSLEILSYAYLLFFMAPTTVPMPRKGPYETAASYYGQVERLTSSLRVRPYEFQPRRMSVAEVAKDIQEHCPVAVLRETAKYSTTYSTAYVDPCIQEYRVDYLLLSVDRLFRTRFGIPLDQPLVTDAPVPEEDCADDALLRAIGCDTPKLFLASKVQIANDLETAARLVRESDDFDRVPVILLETSAEPEAEHVRGELGDVRVADFTANRVEIHADVTAPPGAWLVYLDAFHPGWTARVNGRPAPIAAANLAFKAVRLEAGMNVVEFVFRGHRWSRLCVQVFFAAGVMSVLALAAAIVRLLFSREQAKPA